MLGLLSPGSAKADVGWGSVPGDPLRIYGKSFMVPKTRVFRAADGENLVILACTAFDWSTCVTDGRIDGRTDTIAMTKTRWKQ